MLPHALILKMNQIKCPKHAKMVSHIDLSKICQDGTRVYCKECLKIEGSITKLEFDELCKKLTDNQSLISKTKAQYLKTKEQIFQLIQDLDQLILRNVIKDNQSKKLEDALSKAYKFEEANYGLKEFEILAQVIAEGKDYVSDEKLVESNKYLDLSKQLLQLMENFLLINNIQLQKQQQQMAKLNEQEQKLEQLNQYDKIQSKGYSHITGLYLNFDESILAAKFVENDNRVQLWNFNKIQKKWIPDIVLDCHGESLIDFQFSQQDNTFITTGKDKTEKNIGKWNKQSYSIKFWEQNDVTWKSKDLFLINDKRIQCLALNSFQTLLIAGLGGNLLIFHIQNGEFYQEVNRQISGELINTVGYCADQESFGVGTYDSKVFICSYVDKKFKIIQQIKLIGIAKQIIFGNLNQELFILIKDGLLSINQRENADDKYKEIQRIVNNVEKIRAIQFDFINQILAIGGETNNLQIWQKNDNMQWKCQNQFQQDNFIDCICFSQYHKQIISSNNSEIFIHQRLQ